MSLYIEEGGLFTTVQDLGRKGYLHQGVVESGAMDRAAARNANLAVANEEDAAVLEMTLIGPSITFQTTMLICMVGDGMTPYLDGIPCSTSYPYMVPAGTVLTFKAKKAGMRTYLAIAGGIDVPVVMNSRSTYMRAEIGGYEGRNLRKGDCLAIGQPHPFVQPMIDNMKYEKKGWRANWHIQSPVTEAMEANRHVIRALTGTHFDRLNEESQQQLFESSFTVKNQSDRMGYRLQTESSIAFKESFSLLSEAVALGTVQVPPDGQPIILMADRQTTGGYPRALQVASVEISKLAQLRPGQSFTFSLITLAEAESLYREYEKAIQIRKRGLLLKWEQAN
ncbi:biotin-dependent carboxyltransferase family protein [Shouchella sp. 1P09AA]|uniref:5-oxoprolinase subunit C family protein n=1 Tax=unclassified Shouchella TaxID=2893065 RepID=UPI00399EFB77